MWKYVGQFECIHISCSVKICQVVWIYTYGSVKMCHVVWIYIQQCEYILGSVKIYWAMYKYTKQCKYIYIVCKAVLKYTKQCGNLSNSVKLNQAAWIRQCDSIISGINNVPGSTNLYMTAWSNIRQCEYMSGSVNIYLKVWKYIRQCKKIQGNMKILVKLGRMEKLWEKHAVFAVALKRFSREHSMGKMLS